MRALVIAVALAAFAAMTSASARAQDGLQAELSSLLERYYSALRAGDFGAMMAVASEEFRGMMLSTFSSHAEKQAFLDWQKQSTPASFEVLNLDGGAEEGAATLYILADLKRPPSTPDGQWTDGQAEIDVSFAQEAGVWKLAMIMIGGDPVAIQRSADESYEPIDAYDTDRTVNMGGRIVRIEFHEGHTLVVMRLMHQDEFIYLPPRQELEERGFNPDLLVPHALLQIVGHRHRSDEFKVWATDFNVL